MTFWSITLSLPRYVKLQPSLFSPVAEGGPLQYRRFLIDVETGELVAMKLREVATR